MTVSGAGQHATHCAMIVLAAVVGSPDRSISVNTGVFPAKYGEVPLGVYLQTPEYV